MDMYNNSDDEGFPKMKISGMSMMDNEDKNNINNHAYQMQLQMMQQQMMHQQMMQQRHIEEQNKKDNMIQMFNNMGLNNYNNFNPQFAHDKQIKSINGLTVIFRASGTTGQAGAPIMVQTTPEEKVSDLIEKYRCKAGDRDDTKKFIFNRFNLNPNLTVAEMGLTHNANIFVVATKGVKGGGAWYMKKINIKFIKISKNNYNTIVKYKLNGLLKLSLLKEISSKLDIEKLNNFPDIIKCIMRILKNGYIETEDDIKKTIQEVLKKMEGSNIINFSDFVDETIDSNQIEKMLNLLNKDEFREMNDISFRLSKYDKYMKLFNKTFEAAKKESIFEFSVISLVLMEREDFEKFEREREKCPNRIDKILYHGTSTEPISCILTGLFRKSEKSGYQHGKGVYFTDFLDYCWFYGGEQSNRANKNKIPEINDTFTLIACSVYYDKKGFRKVTDYKYTPKKNEINFAYAGAHFETLVNPDFTKFVGTEYVIWDLDQICPFISAKLKRNEYCVIWRDNNFSSNPVYNNKFDEIFKKFLKERIKYINQKAKYNIYPCETSEEALKLVERKKYNKIILISNVGSDLGGKKFVENARKIIGNDVIVLFLAYNTAHLKWIKDYKNALFSNDPKFYEEYLQCFDEGYSVKEHIQSLIEKMKKHYDVKFNFDETFLDYPHFKRDGKYSDLTFNY